MQHPLDGARLKVVRAQEHLDSLKAEIGAYLDEQPNEVRSQPAKDVRGDLQALPPINPAKPPLRLSTIIGDCVTNARAALDYIVWELARLYFKPPFDRTNRSDRRIVAFPIYQASTDTGLKDRLNRLSDRQVPAAPVNLIEVAQPYNAGYEQLWWLHELVNTDKHQMPLLTIGEFDNMTVTLATPPIYQDLIKETATLTIPRQAIDNRPLYSDVQMKGEVAIYVTWQDVAMPHEPVDRTLENIVKCVASIIPGFDGFF